MTEQKTPLAPDHPTHDRESCSDAEAINMDPAGSHGCARCTALVIDRLRQQNRDQAHALRLALEYWNHRQRRYKNRAPVWVEEARKALSPTTPSSKADAGEGL